MKTIREVIGVKANDDFTLECEMENGEVFLYDLSSVKEATGEMVQPLKDIDYFKKVFVDEYGCLSWPNGIDIDPAVIVLEGSLIEELVEEEA